MQRSRRGQRSTPEELKALNDKLKEANVMLDNLLKPGK